MFLLSPLFPTAAISVLITMQANIHSSVKPYEWLKFQVLHTSQNDSIQSFVVRGSEEWGRKELWKFLYLTGNTADNHKNLRQGSG
jgi:hypothetical protein